MDLEQVFAFARHLYGAELEDMRRSNTSVSEF
jgi:hypothetical protein